MKILLVGEFSRLHNSLKEGLQALGHEVLLVGDGDHFKNFPVDISIKPSFLNRYFLIRKAKNLLYGLTGINLELIESAIRFLSIRKQLKGFDVVQFIHSNALIMPLGIQLKQLHYLEKHNGKLFLSVCGNDYPIVSYLLKNTLKYSVLTPYINGTQPKKDTWEMLMYSTKTYKAYYQKAEALIDGLIPSDVDYLIPLEHHKKNLGLVPNPINTDHIKVCKNLSEKIHIFLGINTATKMRKGLRFFEEALAVIKDKYKSDVKITIVENIPYDQYITLYDQAHILLDQVYAYDQGYNALEAMAKGKTVFTGAETEFLDYYNLQEGEVCINALPNVDYLVEKLSWLIENPQHIAKIGQNARTFIEREHHYVKVAKQYIQKME